MSEVMTIMSVSIDLELRKKLDKICGKNRSYFIREAIIEKIQRLEQEEEKTIDVGSS